MSKSRGIRKHLPREARPVVAASPLPTAELARQYGVSVWAIRRTKARRNDHKSKRAAKVAEVTALHKEGKTYREIAEASGVPYYTVWRWCTENGLTANHRKTNTDTVIIAPWIQRALSRYETQTPVSVR